MTIAPGFQFSQSSLQDFVDCPRRFFLRYVRGLQWPAPESEPLRVYEEHLRCGAQLHHLIHQHLVGIPAALLSETIEEDERVFVWWGRFLNSGLAGLPAQRHPEIALTAPLAEAGGRRIVAKYDLIAIEPGERAVIVDWKTSLGRPRRDRLAARLQTIIYPWLLVRAGASLNEGAPIAPEAVQMIYWFAEQPNHPEVFAYSAEQFARDDAYLRRLAADLLARTADDFPLTEDARLCRYCTFRTLCERGEHAGPFDEIEDWFDDDVSVTFDLDQIAEVAF